jgi:Icc-related predicted phosphoesterase
VTYLQDGGTEVAGVRIWGSPWQPWFYDWAFNLPRAEALRSTWDLIPDDTEILVTHGPPYGILDSVERLAGQWFGEDVAVEVEHTGREELRAAVLRIRPRLNVFGHIHERYGTDRLGETICVNASNCDAAYRPVNPAIVIDLP